MEFPSVARAVNFLYIKKRNSKLFIPKANFTYNMNNFLLTMVVLCLAVLSSDPILSISSANDPIEGYENTLMNELSNASNNSFPNETLALSSLNETASPSDIITTNRAPNTPTVPSGRNSGFAEISYKYFALTADPDKDQVKYTFDWGDGTISQTNPVNSGSAGSAYHRWSKAGTYLVRAMATDSK